MPEPQRMPTYRQVAQMLRTLSQERSEWAGIPMMTGDYDLVLEPKFPYQLRVCRNADVNESAPDEQVINVWWCDKLMGEVWVTRSNGKIGHFVSYHRGGRQGTKLIDNLALSQMAWLMEAELKAMAKLQAMIPQHLFDSYVMTGTFIESSKRSRVTYLFRRLRPTIAMAAGDDGTMRILCALCLHPIGYYKGTHAGVMVPTDEVLAHLIYMRGDEHAFWKQANQHPPNHPNAAI